MKRVRAPIERRANYYAHYAVGATRLRFAFDDVVNYAKLARFNAPLVLRLRSFSCSQPLAPFQRTGCRFKATFIYKYATIWKCFQNWTAEKFRGSFIEFHSNQQTNIIRYQNMKKPKKNEKSRLVKVSNIDCVNGNTIIIGQLRRETETEPIVWKFEVRNPSGETLHTGQNQYKYVAFNQALNLACSNC